MNWKTILAAGAMILFSGNSIAQQCFPAPDGLVSWWPMDNSTLDFADGNNPSAESGISFAPGQVGSGVTFGELAYIEILPDTNLNLTVFTVEAWVRPDAVWRIDSFGSIIVQHAYHWPDSNTYVTLSLSYNSNEFVFLIGDVFTEGVWSTNSFPLGNFYHVAATYDGTTARLYVDGSLEGELPISKAVIHDPTVPWSIGSTHTEYIENGSPRTWVGVIDEVTVYDRALSVSEIQAIYDTGTAGKCQDEDGDGFRPPLDCNDFDPAINPDAIELPGNFVDENCDGDLGGCDPCIDWRNHGEYVRCVAHAVNDLGGLITLDNGDMFVTSAAQSDIGKRGFVPDECN